MDMKTTKAMLKLGLVGLFLTTFITLAQAQTIDKDPQAKVVVGPETPISDAGRVTAITPLLTGGNSDYETLHAVLFYNPATSGPGLTFVASLVEDHDTRTGGDALEFTMYKWSYMGADGVTPTTLYGLDAGGTEKTVGVDDPANRHTVTSLAPGFHYFRVEGYIIPEGADDSELCTVEDETFVVYVLPPLAVTTTHTGENGLLQYCEIDATTQQNVQMTATVAYDGYTGDPAIADGFELKYTWYAVKSENATDIFADDIDDFPTIDPTKVDIGDAVAQPEAIVVSSSNEFTPTIAEIGSYKFFVEVEYTVKARDYDGAETDDARKRVYAIYRQWFGGADQDLASVVFVTPQPGKPHITVEGVTD
ncbi:hypothetical protein [Parapedobacter sp. 2B3]|uniref:hypothetical protein n=1 Tax=Parapedobacter sp. 2B3 TaxID=3342381 RepID=UPI0035B5C717